MTHCKVDGCHKLVIARSLCGTHYARWRKHGSIEKPKPVQIPNHIRPIPGYEGYFCDQHGNVFSNRLKGRHLEKAGPLRLMNMRKRMDGYLQVHMRGNSAREAPLVHQLVMLTWCGPKPERCVINHKNGVKFDNSFENLEYVTQKQNIRHAIDVLKRDFRRRPKV